MKLNPINKKNIVFSFLIFLFVGFLFFTPPNQMIPVKTQMAEGATIPATNTLKLLPNTLKKLDSTTFEIDLYYEDSENNPLPNLQNEIRLLASGRIDWLEVYEVVDYLNGYYKVRFDVGFPYGIFKIQGLSLYIIEIGDIKVTGISTSSEIITIFNTEESFLISKTESVYISPFSYSEKFLKFLNSLFTTDRIAWAADTNETKQIPLTFWVEPETDLDRAQQDIDEARRIYAKYGFEITVHYKFLPKNTALKFDFDGDGMLNNIQLRDTDGTVIPSEIDIAFPNLPKVKGMTNVYLINLRSTEYSGITNKVDGNQIILPTNFADHQDNSVFSHELGHSLGLNHEAPTENNLMYYCGVPGIQQNQLDDKQITIINKTYDKKVVSGEIIPEGNGGEVVKSPPPTSLPPTSSGESGGADCYRGGAATPGGSNVWAPCCNCGLKFYGYVPVPVGDCGYNSRGCDIPLGCKNLYGKGRAVIWDPSGICGVG